MRVVHLSHGSGNGIDRACLMTASNMLIGRGKDGDDNHCVCKFLRAFIVTTNDTMPLDLLQELYTPLIWEILGTRTDDPEILVDRAFCFADWAVREIVPLAMESAGLRSDADRLRALDRIVGRESAAATSSAVAAARAAAGVVRDDATAADAARYDAQEAARAAFFALRAANYIAYAATFGADIAVDSAACAAAGAATATSIWHKCPEIIRRVAAIGDKRPVEIVLSNDQLCERLNRE